MLIKPHCHLLLQMGQHTRKGASTVWVQGGNSGLDKRQCTIQLTIFADGIPRVKLLVIFRGIGKQVTFQKKLKYDKRISVCFHGVMRQ